MQGTWGRLRGCAPVALILVCGCGRDPLPLDPTCLSWLPGDLVITEIHANPDGTDGTREYLEIYNPGTEAVSTYGLTLATSRRDGTGAVEHRLGGLEIAAQEFVVFGNAPLGALPPHLDVSYGDALGNLRNSEGAIEIRCGDVVVDRVAYEATSDGRALAFDGARPPSAEQNDDVTGWCSPNGASEFAPGDFGSPGATNDPCAIASEADDCLDGGERRASVQPEPGDVEIVEWMPNPSGPDGELEWIELTVSVPVDLHGLRLGSSIEAVGASFVGDECFPVDAGTRVVFGASPGAAPRVDADLPVSLGNTGERNLVLAVDDVVLDRVDYLGSTEGVSWQRDDTGAVCLTETLDDHEYASLNFGTPGAPNPPCVPALEPGWCVTASGRRPIDRPLPGAVQILEWMAAPVLGGSRDGEWIELLFADDADLNGLTWSDRSGSGRPIESERCLEVSAGTRLVFARSADPADNGGLERVDGVLDVSLNNAEEWFAVGVEGTLLDAVEYEAAKPGVATQIDGMGFWCEATSSYGDGDLGTPGAPNPACD